MAKCNGIKTDKIWKYMVILFTEMKNVKNIDLFDVASNLKNILLSSSNKNNVTIHINIFFNISYQTKLKIYV